VLEKYEVELIAASRAAIDMAEDRELFRNAMREIGLETPQSQIARSLDEPWQSRGKSATRWWCARPSLRWQRRRIAYNREELETIVARGWTPPDGEVLLEESVAAGKNSRWRWCAITATTASSSARSRTSIRWACIPATRSPSRPH